MSDERTSTATAPKESVFASRDRRRVIIAMHDPRARERQREVLVEMGLDIAGLAGDGQEAVQLAALLSPDFILLDETLPILGTLETAFGIRTVAPEVATIVMAESESLPLFRDAMRYGVRDVITKPVDTLQLQESLLKLWEINQGVQTPAFKSLLDPTMQPSVFCISGGKGGVGKTMVATNLALALCADGERTVLVDLYTQFGDVAAALNMKPTRTLAEMSSMVDDIDAHLVAGYAQRHSSGLDVMFGSDSPLPLDAISAACVDRLLSVLKREYKYVVFDTPPYLYATTLQALSLANAVLLVCNLFDYTTIADTKQLYDTLNGAYVTSDRLKIVVNRVSTLNKFHLEDVERAFGHGIFAEIPNDSRVVALLNTGYPSHSSIADTALGRAVATLRDALLNPAAVREDIPVSAPAARPGRMSGFLRKITERTSGR